MAKDIEVEVLNPTDAERDELQRLADRLAAVKRELAEASATEDDIRDESYERFDAIAGPETYVIFESGPPTAGWRMVRQIAQVPDYGLAGLRKVLTPSVFRSITRETMDAAALQVAIKQGKVDPDVIKRYTTWSTRASGPLWKASAGDIHLTPGQLAIVRRVKP
jgi:hypothetical protein